MARGDPLQRRFIKFRGALHRHAGGTQLEQQGGRQLASGRPATRCNPGMLLNHGAQRVGILQRPEHLIMAAMKHRGTNQRFQHRVRIQQQNLERRARGGHHDSEDPVPDRQQDCAQSAADQHDLRETTKRLAHRTEMPRSEILRPTPGISAGAGPSPNSIAAGRPLPGTPVTHSNTNASEPRELSGSTWRLRRKSSPEIRNFSGGEGSSHQEHVADSEDAPVRVAGAGAQCGGQNAV